ncbi:hypothetical protein KKH30_03030, partial [Candidatus Micrarchaeota archaeon]|nr:hypothetical protein [Candidatus Micrarchaeota archaeon]MBU1939709.1 hypothetical protein [Candidatus Micrarchaeota archaeon]
LLGLVGGAITGKGGMKSTIAATAVGFLAGTIQEYMSQETQEFWSIQRDVEIKGLTLLMHRGSDDEERDILTDWYGDAMFEKSTVDPRLKFEFRGIKFTNDSQGSFITSEEEPEYRILRVGAISHNYQDKTYNKDDFELENEKSWFGFESGTERVDTTEVKLDEDEPDNVQKYYQIEFNSVPPGEEGEESTGIINCQAGTRTGSTGREALPRVALSWDWRVIDYDACDFDNPGYIYCDATQFSIALLKKIHALDEWLAGSSARLDCPGAMGEAGENTAEIGSYDVGISRVSAKKEGNGIAVEVEILNNDNPQEADVDLTVAVKDSEGNIAAEPCEIMEIGVLSKDIETCVFELEDGVYTATANIEVRMEGCDDCVNKTASDELRVGFSVGNSGLEECEPYSTARLDEFLAASGISEEGVLENVKFKAYLIKDRYSNDFMRDFDDYAMTMSFFNAPEWYKDRSRGLGKYFRNSDVFEFKPKYGDANPEGYALPGPGLYDVTVDITYEDDTWNLFSAGGIENAKISVELEKLDQPEPDSPFYYMPFDGPIGEDSGRVGYGVNYRGDSITINSTGDKVSTVEIPGSTPVDNGLLQVTYSDSLSRLNGGRGFAEEKGTVLKVSRAGTPSILYMPSYATPVMMGVSKETASDNEAWGFYSVAIDGRAASASETGSAKWTGTSMARWNGVGYNCRDFDDRPVTESFYESADQHGLKTSCARLGGDVAMTSYGFEFCDVIKFGNVYMKAIFYTPQGHSGMLAKSGTAKDGVSFWAGNMADARRVELNGVKGVPYNYHGTSRITSVEDVFSLVEDGYVCVSGGGTSADFWWNPAKIYGDETFQSYEDVARQNCITSD